MLLMFSYTVCVCWFNIEYEQVHIQGKEYKMIFTEVLYSFDICLCVILVKERNDVQPDYSVCDLSNYIIITLITYKPTYACM